MAISDKLWDALTTVIKMNDKIIALSSQIQMQQQKIEDLTGRVIRLETALEIALTAGAAKRLEDR